MLDVSEMTQTKPATVTAAAVRTWLATDAIVNTPFGTAKAFGAFYGQKPADLFVGLRVVDPWAAPAPYPVPGWGDCLEAMQDLAIFYTHADGWLTNEDFVSRRAQMKVGDLTNPDVIGLSEEQKRVLIMLRRHCIGVVDGSVLKIDDLGRVWGEVFLQDARPRKGERGSPVMHGRDLVKHVRALERAGVFVRTGTYALRSVYGGTPYRREEPNGWIRVVD